MRRMIIYRLRFAIFGRVDGNTPILSIFFPERFAILERGFAQWQQAQIDNPPVVHPVIRTHPSLVKR